MKAYVQVKSSNETWYDLLGSDDVQTCFDYADHYRSKYNEETRVIERVDTVVFKNIVSGSF